MKKISSIFLIIVFLNQMLPVQQVISLVFGNQLIDVVPQGIDDAANKNFKSIDNSEFLVNIYEEITQYYTNISQSISELKVIFPHNHSTDINTPPPNC